VTLAAPLIAFNLIQNAVNLAFLAMIGRLGTAALAGSGIAGVVFSLLLALLYGFDTGVQAFVSRATGAGEREVAGRALSEAHALSLPFGALLAFAAFHYGPAIAQMLASGANVAAAARANLHGIAPALFFYAVTIPINAYWIGTGSPRIAFFVTALTAPVQVGLLFLLVFGAGSIPALGLFGAGLAQTGACAFALVLQLVIARVRRVPGLFRAPRISGVIAIVKIGWPVSLQQSLSQVAMLIGYAIVSEIGTAETALLNVLTTLMLVPVLTATGLGTASATLVGQALGRGDRDDAKAWGWQIARAGAAIAFPLGLLALFAPAFVLGLFLTDPKTLALALFPARLLGLIVSVEVFSIILGFSLRGAGATKAAAGTSFTLQWALLLPLIWFVAVRMHGGFNALVVVQVALMAVEASVFSLIWARGRWARVRIAALDQQGETRSSVGQKRYERIIVKGGAGAGKSTLSRALGKKFGLPVIHLDRYVYGPGWKKVEFAEVRARVAQALASNRWVVDGTYSDLHDLMLPQADLVIWIEQPAWRRLYRTWRKTRIHRNRPRSDRPDDCEERFTLGYVMTILSFGRFTRAIARKLEAAAPARVLCLKGDHAVAAFLASVRPAEEEVASLAAR
jgi:putative MATE family efflux protein